MPLTLVNDVIQKNYDAMIPWARRKKCGDHYKLKKNVRHILDLISGNMVVCMLNEILTKNEKVQLNLKYKNALVKKSQICNSTGLKEKYKFINALRKSGFTCDEVKSLGYKTSKRLWKTCLDNTPRDKGGRPAFAKHLKGSINNYMESISNVASNRTMSYSEAYDKFPFKEKISFGSYYRYVDDKYKKPHRLTDLCDYCEYYRKLKYKICLKINEIDDNDAESPDPNFYIAEVDAEKLIKHYKNEKYSNNEDVQSLIDDLNDYREISYHRSIAQRQRNVNNQMKTNVALLKTHLLIDIDFKQKIVIGIGPQEVNSSYYNRIQRSLLGFGVHYTNERNEIECLNMDVVLNDTSQTAYSVTKAFNLIRETDVFKKLDKKKYIIWTDCGTHFRCGELAYYFFDELPKLGVMIDWHLFAEKHGKNSRDQHFSVLTYYLEMATYEKRLTKTSDIVESIIEKHSAANQRRMRLKQKPIKLWIEEMPLNNNEKKIKRYCKNITNLKCFYHFKLIKVDKSTKIIENPFIVHNSNEYINDDNESSIELNDEENYENDNYSANSNILNDGNHVKYVNVTPGEYKLVTSIFSDIDINVYTNFVVVDAAKEPKKSTLNLIDENKESDLVMKKIHGGFKTKRLNIKYFMNIYSVLRQTQSQSNEARQQLNEINTNDTQHLSDNINTDKGINTCFVESEHMITPKFCNPSNKNCLNCREDCALNINDLNSYGQRIINKELGAHSHPQSLNVKRGRHIRKRSTPNAREELRNHYMYAHNTLKIN